MFSRIAAIVIGIGFLSGTVAFAKPDLANDIPEKFNVKTDTFDYERRVEMIPMRDGVKLNTVILIPKGATGAPIVLGRTPYGAGATLSRADSPNLRDIVPPYLDTIAAAGFIIAVQDVRGKYKSEGSYVMTRPVIGPLNGSDTDHSTDTYDTIDWLAKNISESSGRVAVIGGSYGGFTALMATVSPHPALKAVVPIAPMVDGWIGDDWFHNGAFRQSMALEYVYAQEATRATSERLWSGYRDEYIEWLGHWSADSMARAKGIEDLGFWKALAAHPAYDSYWQMQALDKFFAQRPIAVPMMIVSGLFDQEDIYGGPALFRALSKRPDAAGRVFLALGPWNHGGSRSAGDAIGQVRFEGRTGAWFRRNVMQPFLDHYLKDAPKPDLAPALVYQTGTDRWQRFQTWPRSCADACASGTTPIYLRESGRLSFQPPAKTDGGADSYISDPAKPVPFMPRPVITVGPDSRWGEWLMIDQRFADGRPDVLTYTTEPLTQPVTVSGRPLARLFASTTGTDADFVVKLIDVWPEREPNQPVMGGFQQMISADIMRGRYREDPAAPKKLTPGRAVEFDLHLPDVNHVFLRGHRIMVQVQSTWFPLYDRNPQRFVENIFFAQQSDFTAATHTIHRSPDRASLIELPIVPADRP